jgi:hypothetical protein
MEQLIIIIFVVFLFSLFLASIITITKALWATLVFLIRFASLPFRIIYRQLERLA